MERKKVGEIGEKLARNFLKKKGYRIRETNYRSHEGEIDIIAEKKDCLVFVEVRTKTSSNFGSPEESVTTAKKEKLIALALAYLNSLKIIPSSWRIDFIAVELNQKGEATRIELIENAIS